MQPKLVAIIRAKGVVELLFLMIPYSIIVRGDPPLGHIMIHPKYPKALALLALIKKQNQYQLITLIVMMKFKLIEEKR